MTDIHLRASDILAKHRLGFNGLIVTDPRNVEHDFVNLKQSLTHVEQLAVSSANGTDTFVLKISSPSVRGGAVYDYSFTSTSGATAAALAAAEIVEDWNSDAERTAIAWASLDGSNVILTAPWPGAAWALTVTDESASGGPTFTATTLTAGADAVEAPFGAAIVTTPPSRTSILNPPSGFGRDRPSVGAQAGGIAGIFTISAHGATILVGGTWEDAKTARITLRLGNDVEVFDVDSVTSLAATATAINAALQASNLVTSAVNTATVTLTAKRLGETLVVTIHELDASTITYTVTNGAAGAGAATIQNALLGIVAYKPTMYDTKVLGTAALGVPAGEEGILLEEGFFLTKLPDASSPDIGGAVLYVGTSGSEKGKLYTSSSATRIRWGRCRVRSAVRDGFFLCRLLPLDDQE